jgi:hypothetical protein
LIDVPVCSSSEKSRETGMQARKSEKVLSLFIVYYLFIFFALLLAECASDCAACS